MIPIYFQWMAAEDRKSAREDARLDAEAGREATLADNYGPGASALRRPHAGWTGFRPNAR